MRKIVVDNSSSIQETTIKYSADTKRLLYDRFGMFIHFGPYSVLGGEYKGKRQRFGSVEWIMRFEEIPRAEYQKVAYEFNPELGWADELAEQAKIAGVKYAVLTTKHHDGFCLFKSDYSVYNSYHYNGRDLVREYVDAMRKVGIEPGFYYSHTLDWAERDGAGQINLAFGGNPMKNDNFWDYPDRAHKDFKRYFYGKCIPQVKELLENYGDIYLMWFDFAHDITPDQSKELYTLVKDIQPHCVVNSRIAHGYGDYNSLGDNTVPTVSIGVPNECLITLNDSWGYSKYDNNWKTADEVIGMLARCTSGDSTLLMNVGPMSSGKIPDATCDILKKVGTWVKKNDQAIHGVKQTPFKCGFEWGSVATSEDGLNLYLYVTDNDCQQITLSGIRGGVLSVCEIGGENQPFEYDGEILTIKVKCKSVPVSVVKITFNNVPTYKDIPVQHGNELTLKPIYAEKYRVDGDVHTKVELVFQHNIYDPMWGKRGLCLERNDTLSAWANADEYLEWQAEVKTSGEYECLIATGKQGGDSEPIIEVQGQTVSSKIEDGKEYYVYNLSRTGGENLRYVYKLGKVHLEKGKTEVFLKRKGNGHNIPVSELKFVKK